MVKEFIDCSKCMNQKKAQVLDKLVKEIPNMARFESADGQDLVMALDIMMFIKNELDEDS